MIEKYEDESNKFCTLSDVFRKSVAELRPS